jgi:hypothetical protein
MAITRYPDPLEEVNFDDYQARARQLLIDTMSYVERN